MTIIDVSYHQGAIDWARAKTAGVECALIKCSGAEIGRVFTDTKFAANWKGAKAAGIRRGCYHFLHGGMDGEDQADYYLDAVAKVDPFAVGDILPIVDVEWPKEGGHLCDIENVIAFIGRIQDKAAAVPIIYTGAWYWNAIKGDKDFASDCPLWLAAYTKTCPPAPKPWNEVALWQFSDKGAVDGIATLVDVNQRFADWEEITL